MYMCMFSPQVNKPKCDAAMLRWRRPWFVWQVCGQRDRFKNRLESVEEEKNKVQVELKQSQDAAHKLRADNVKLYERIRFLQVTRLLPCPKIACDCTERCAFFFFPLSLNHSIYFPSSSLSLPPSHGRARRVTRVSLKKRPKEQKSSLSTSKSTRKPTIPLTNSKSDWRIIE